MRVELLEIIGGYQLKGEIGISGAKNSAGHLLAASMLTDEDCIIHNVPEIIDTDITINIMRNCGVKVKKVAEHSYGVKADSIKTTKVNSQFGSVSRAPAIFLGALAARCKEVIIPLPGGNHIGERPLDRHLTALESLGFKVGFNGKTYFAKAQKLKSAKIFFEKNTHMGTDNVLLTACLIPGTTVIENAAEEPEVDDMINFLNSMGAKIRRIGKRRIQIEGVKKLHGTEYKAISDRNEAVTFGIVALITGGNLFLRNAVSEHMTAFLDKVLEMGGYYQVENSGIRVWPNRKLKAVNITTGCHPGFMTDWQPQFTTLLTQAKGESIVVERVHSNRFGFIKELEKMKARFLLFNPKVDQPEQFYDFDLEEGKNFYHACKVFGPASLKGTKVNVSDIRAGAALVLAALCAEGKTIISGTEHLDRGYEKLVEKLVDVGAAAKRMSI